MPVDFAELGDSIKSPIQDLALFILASLQILLPEDDLGGRAFMISPRNFRIQVHIENLIDIQN